MDKKFLINVSSNIYLNNNIKDIQTGVYFCLKLKGEFKELIVSIDLYSWSDNKQKYVPLKNSIWTDDEFGGGQYITNIEYYYKSIKKKFLDFIYSFKYNWQLKELIFRLENPDMTFHYKLLNSFQKTTLEKIYKKHFNNYPILNITFLKTENYIKSFSKIFLPKYVHSFFIDGIEVTVDLNENDYPLFEDLEIGKISKNEFLERVHKL